MNSFPIKPYVRFHDELTQTQRLLVIGYICPNGENLTEPALDIFFSLRDEGIIEFAEAGTANEHLHVKHPRNESARWCLVCAATTRPQEVSV